MWRVVVDSYVLLWKIAVADSGSHFEILSDVWKRVMVTSSSSRWNWTNNVMKASSWGGGGSGVSNVEDDLFLISKDTFSSGDNFNLNFNLNFSTMSVFRYWLDCACDELLKSNLVNYSHTHALNLLSSVSSASSDHLVQP